MGISKELNRGRHCVSALHVHLVFITKLSILGLRPRRPRPPAAAVFEDLHRLRIPTDGDAWPRPPCPLAGSLSTEGGSLEPGQRSPKGVSSRMLIQERPDLAPRYWKGVLWSPSYFAASCGAAPINMLLKSYIEQQNTPRGRLKGPYIPGLKSRALRPHG